jgi:hypothetical protein
MKQITRLMLLIYIIFSAAFLQPPQLVQAAPPLMEPLPPLITPPGEELSQRMLKVELRSSGTKDQDKRRLQRLLGFLYSCPG